MKGETANPGSSDSTGERGSSGTIGADEDGSEPIHRISASGVIRAICGLGLGAAIATGVGYAVGARPASIVAYAAGVSPLMVAGCAVSGFVVLALQSARWHSVMRPLLGLSYAQACRAQLVGFLFNAMLPARGGDLLRVQYLGRRSGKSRATILGTEVVDRWLDWWGWIPTFLVLCVLSHPPYWLFKALGIFGSLLVAWAAGMLVATRSGFRPRSDTRVGRIWTALATGVRAFRSPRIWAIALLLAPLPWLWESLAITWAARAFGIELSWLMAFSVLIGFNLAMVVPSPGAVGSVEAGGTAAMLFFGIDQSKAMAFMFVYHFTQLLPGVMGGVVLLVVEREKLFGARAPRLLVVQGGDDRAP
jgi:glycosyltransferase 2 family protein